MGERNKEFPEAKKAVKNIQNNKVFAKNNAKKYNYQLEGKFFWGVIIRLISVITKVKDD